MVFCFMVSQCSEGLEQQREERRDSRTERPPGAKWEDALMRVIIAIAVAILARRMLVKRMV